MAQSSETSVTSTELPANLPFVLIAGVLAISSSAILIRFAQAEGLPSILIATARLMIAAFAMTPFVVRGYWQHISTISQRDLLFAVGAGIFLALHFASWVTSLEYTSVLISVVIVTSSPIWVALLEVFFLRAKLPRRVAIGLVIAIVGGLLIGFGGSSVPSEGSSTDGLGALLSLIGAVTVAAYLIIGRKLRSKMPILPYIWLVYGCAGLALTLILLGSGTPILGYSPTAYVLLFAMAIFPQLVGHSALNYAVGYLPATTVSLITQLEPIGSAILALLLFSEVPLPIQILGSAVILAGVTFASLNPNRRNKRSA